MLYLNSKGEGILKEEKNACKDKKKNKKKVAIISTIAGVTAIAGIGAFLKKKKNKKEEPKN